VAAQHALVQQQAENGRLKAASAEESERLRQSEEERAYVMSGARCLLWYADVRQVEGREHLVWDAHFVDPVAAQRLMPVEILPGEIYQHARIRARSQEDDSRVRRICEENIRAGSSYTLEYRCRALDGSVRWEREDIHVETVQEDAHWRAIGVCTDVTAAKLAEEALEKSEELYRSVGEAVPDFVWACGPMGEPLFANQRWSEYTGLVLGKSDMPMDVLHHPDDFPALREIWTKARMNAEPYSAEVRIRRHDGEYRWFLARAVPIKDEAGAITQWIGTTTDIHERKLAEDAVRRSEAHYRHLTDAMPQLAWISLADGAPEYFNQGWYDYTGTSPDVMLGADRPSLIHPDDRTEARARWDAAVAAGEPYDVEYRLRGADGAFRWFLARAIPLKDGMGRVTRWFGTCTDIETRKRATQKERFLAESSAALASSLDYETTLATVASLAVPDLADWCVVHVVEADANVRRLAVAHADPGKVKWAQELQSRYPYDPDSPRGIANVLRTGRTEFYPVISDEMLVAGALDEDHLRLMRQVGFTAVMIVPMIARGNVLGAITFVSAESGRPYEPADVAVAEDLAHSAALAVDNARSFKAAREELERREETERRLRAHQLEIEKLNARLRQSVEVTHHHVRNNLQIILALTQLPVEEGKDTVPVSALDRIGHHTTSLAAMHELLMQQARANADVECLSARTALEKMLPLLATPLHGREIRYTSDDIVLPVQEIGSLCILVNELVTNAIQHGAGTIQLGVKAQHGVARLEVCDEGPGFPPDFDPSIAAATGLCLVDMAARHDLRGDIRFETRPEGGARVIVEFPLGPS
jgi:PAS domain S-box-containing protein